MIKVWPAVVGQSRTVAEALKPGVTCARAMNNAVATLAEHPAVSACEAKNHRRSTRWAASLRRGRDPPSMRRTPDEPGGPPLSTFPSTSSVTGQPTSPRRRIRWSSPEWRRHASSAGGRPSSRLRLMQTFQWRSGFRQSRSEPAATEERCISQRSGTKTKKVRWASFTLPW